MLVAELIGGNEVEGFKNGKVFVDGEVLPASYEQLSRICGNISLGEMDISSSVPRMIRAYAENIVNYGLDNDFTTDVEGFIEKNFLLSSVSYSSYKLNGDTNAIDLHIDIFG